MTKYLNISTDNTLGGNSPSNEIVVSQKAIKEYVDSQSGSSSYTPNIFDWKWADHELDDMSWLRADTGSWQDGTVYSDAYNHLVNDIQNNSAKFYAWTQSSPSTTIYTGSVRPKAGDTVYTLSQGHMIDSGSVVGTVSSGSITLEGSSNVFNRNSSSDGTYSDPLIERIGNVPITYYLAPDGHKICLSDQELPIEIILALTGVAWYYVLDTTNTKFMLPRTQYGVVGYRDAVGDYVAPGLPNITATLEGANSINSAFIFSGSSGAITLSNASTYSVDSASKNTNGRRTATFSAANSNSIYGNSSTVQPPATQMYLYFYVGQFSQSAIEQTAGLNAELFNGKVDIGHEVIAFQEPTAANNYTWYRKYRDGWVEQGGMTAGGTSPITVNLPVEMADGKYQIQLTATINNSSYDYTLSRIATVQYTNNSYSQNTTSFRCFVTAVNGASSVPITWQVSGMAA